MQPMIQKLVLKRFRSFPADKLELDNPTFLVGCNGSGKSNLVDAFAFLADAMTSPLQAVFDNRGGIGAVRNRTSSPSYPPNLGLAVVFGPLNGDVRSGRYAFEIRALPNYSFKVVREQCRVESKDGGRLWFDRCNGRLESNVPGLNPSLDPALLGLPVVAGEARFAPVLKALAAIRVYRLEPGKLREMQDPDAGTSLRGDGRNGASVLQELERHAPEDVKRLVEILGTIVPDMRKVQTVKHGNKLSFRFTQEWGKQKRLNFDAFSMSDGTLRALGLLLAVYQQPTPALLIVEEPEATIHPGALGALLDVLKHACRKMQVLVATHSPEVLDADWLEDRHLRIVTWEEGATRVAGLAEASRKALRGHLMGAGELLRSNALDPASLFVDVADPQLQLFEEER